MILIRVAALCLLAVFALVVARPVKAEDSRARAAVAVALAMRRVPPPPAPTPAKGGDCSALCTCGCQEGQPCACPRTVLPALQGVAPHAVPTPVYYQPAPVYFQPTYQPAPAYQPVQSFAPVQTFAVPAGRAAASC